MKERSASEQANPQGPHLRQYQGYLFAHLGQVQFGDGRVDGEGALAAICEPTLQPERGDLFLALCQAKLCAPIECRLVRNGAPSTPTSATTVIGTSSSGKRPADNGREVAQRRVAAHSQAGHPADQPGTFRPRAGGALPGCQRRVSLYRLGRAARSDGPG